MNELIKSEAEKYCGTTSLLPEMVQKVFTAGFNRCLELAKSDNDEAHKVWFKTLEYSDQTFNSYNYSKDGFLAASKLKDVEIMELKDKLSNFETDEPRIQMIEATNKALEEKLKVAESSYEKLAYAFDDLNVQNNYHAAKMVNNGEKLKVAVELIVKIESLYKENYSFSEARINIKSIYSDTEICPLIEKIKAK